MAGKCKKNNCSCAICGDVVDVDDAVESGDLGLVCRDCADGLVAYATTTRVVVHDYPESTLWT